MKSEQSRNRSLLRVAHMAVFSVSISFFVFSSAFAAPQRVTNVAGGRLGDGGPATSASFALPSAVVRDANGNLYVADALNCRIRRVSASGTITTFAGTGICGTTGDGGPANGARILNVTALVFDKNGNLLFTNNNSIRSIAPNGTISTIVGTGRAGYSGDGGPALKATLYFPGGLAVDASNDIYIADTDNNVIREVDTTGIIRTVAGNHTLGYSGDGGPATAASLYRPQGVAAGSGGQVYISDTNNGRVRVFTIGGNINTFAGNGKNGNTGSGGPATNAAISGPWGLRLGPGTLYLSSTGNTIWAVDLSTRIIITIAGNGTAGYGGDGGKALSGTFNQPYGIALDGAGGILVADSGNGRIRHIDINQNLSSVAGGNLGDNGPATMASLNGNAHIAFDPEGSLYIADVDNCRVRKVPTSGIISTIAGTGFCGYTGDGGPAAAATLNLPQAVAADGNGNVYIADTGNAVIRKIDSSGTITTFVSALSSGSSVISAIVVAMAVDGSGNLYASDGIFAIWKITPSGAATAAAGSLFNVGYNGDGIPATQAWLFLPRGVAVDAAGNLYITDWLNERIRKVDAGGIISTIAGNGLEGFDGDGGPATSARLNLPTDVAVDGNGNIYIADWINYRIRVVDVSGTINTFAGSGGYGYNGNDVLATKAHLLPTGVAVRDGIVYFTDEGSDRVRKVH